MYLLQYVKKLQLHCHVCLNNLFFFFVKREKAKTRVQRTCSIFNWFFQHPHAAPAAVDFNPTPRFLREKSWRWMESDMKETTVNCNCFWSCCTVPIHFWISKSFSSNKPEASFKSLSIFQSGSVKLYSYQYLNLNGTSSQDMHACLSKNSSMCEDTEERQ